MAALISMDSTPTRTDLRVAEKYYGAKRVPHATMIQAGPNNTRAYTINGVYLGLFDMSAAADEKRHGKV